MLVLDWLKIATVEAFICTRFWPSRMLVVDCANAAAISGVKSTNSEGSATFEMKLKPETREDLQRRMRWVDARINYRHRNSRAGKTGGRLQIELADNGRSGLCHIVAGHQRSVVIHHSAARQAI